MMAEHSFREVMHEVNRLCMAHNNCDNDCPLENMGCCGNLGAYCSDPLKVERIENAVMAWAAEHPEPVYPTWGEWLCDMHVVGVQARQVTLPCLYYIIESAMHKPIPADIAEKLGLKPKEE